MCGQQCIAAEMEKIVKSGTQFVGGDKMGHVLTEADKWERNEVTDGRRV